MKSFGISIVLVSLLGLCLLWGLAGSPAYGDFTFGEAANMGPAINTDGDEGDATLSPDGLELYFSGPDRHIWVARRATVNSRWERASSLGQLVKDNSTEATPWVSSDGLRLYFTSAGPAGVGMMDLWVTARATTKDNWGIPVNLGPTVNTSERELYPCVSADELELYYAGWRGEMFLFGATRATKDAPWGTAVALPINAGWTGIPYLSPDGLSLYFVSDRAGAGSYDMYVATRATRSDPWTSPTRLGAPFSSFPSASSLSAISPDQTMYYITSDRPGGYGGWDLWQVPIVPVLDLNGDGSVDAADMALLVANLGKTNLRCDIAPLPRGDGVVDDKDLAALMEGLMTPGQQASDVPCNTALMWLGCPLAASYDVYFGTSFADVNSADRTNPLGVLVSQGQTDFIYVPERLLEYGKTYYWRVDVVTAPPDQAIYKGRVLEFTTEPFAYPIAKVTAAASSSFLSTTGPVNTVNRSGLNYDDTHGTGLTTMWASKKGQSPAWIQYEFDEVYTVDQMWVWNGNQASELTAGLGAKDVTVEYSTDGSTWTVLADVPQFAQATGQSDYVHNTTVDFQGAQAKFVKLTLVSNWGGKTIQYNLSEVRFFYIPERSY